MLRPLNAPEAREPRTGRQPTTTEADVRPLRSFFETSLPASGIASCEAISTLRLYFRRHFKAATSVPPLDHVRVRPGAGYAFFYQSMFSTQPKILKFFYFYCKNYIFPAFNITETDKTGYLFCCFGLFDRFRHFPWIFHAAAFDKWYSGRYIKLYVLQPRKENTIIRPL